MKQKHRRSQRVFSLSDWLSWLNALSRESFGISGAEFEIAFRAGRLRESGVAQDMATVLPLIEHLRVYSAER